MIRVGQSHINIYNIYIRYSCGVFGKTPPNIQSFTVHIYGSGQPYF